MDLILKQVKVEIQKQKANWKPEKKGDNVTHMRLNVQQTHFAFGQDRANRVQGRPVVIPFELSVLDEPERGKKGDGMMPNYWSLANLYSK